MNWFNQRRTHRDQSNSARAAWRSTHREKKALDNHSYVQQISRVDEIWPWLERNYGSVTAVDAPHAAYPETFNYSQLANQITQASHAFKALGIKEGDVVAFFSENGPRWLIVDQGLMRAGAIDAVRGVSAPIEELKYIVEDSGAIALVVQTRELLQKLELSNDQRTRLRFVLQLEGTPLEGVIGWQEFFEKANKNDSLETQSIEELDSTAQKTATILYTSGTTGRPKGVPLTHGNLLHQIKSLACIANPLPGDPVLSVLPIWHSYERSAEYYFFSRACSQTYTTIKQLKYDLPRVRPIVMATVPRLWESVQIGFEDALKKMPRRTQVILRFALANSRSYKFALRQVRNLLIEKIVFSQRILSLINVIFRWPLHALASGFLWPKILRQLSGGRLIFPINGGGAIAPHVDAFFESLGVELLVGYGLTETSPVVSCRRPWRNIRGSSGLPLPETEFRIVDPETGAPKKFCERGLVLVKGPQVMTGYLGKPEDTEKVLDKNGWLNTGDLGMLLRDGSLVLTGRAKDTIVLSSGENIEPGPLEEAIVASPLIEQVMMVGQDQKQLGALIVPNIDAILEWSQQKGLNLPENLGGGPGDQDLRKLLRSEINVLLADRKGSRMDERVLGVALVDLFSIDNGLLTQTLKQRREKIAERDRASIDSIFAN